MTFESPRQELLLDADWLFHLGDIDSPVPRDKHIAAYMANKAGWARGAARINYDDSDWRILNLPHDWSVEGPFDPGNYLDNGFLPRGVAWYRKHLRLDESDRGKYLALRFDGVSSHCTVFVNGHVLHRNFSGYTSFTIDISDVATFGDDAVNVIAVRVEATPIEGWWYEGAGIYRHAWLIKAHPLHISPHGLFVYARRRSEEFWDTSFEITARNSSDEPLECLIGAEIREPDGEVIVGQLSQPMIVPARATEVVRHSLQVTRPLQWSLQTPSLYRVRGLVVVGKTMLDECAATFGYRTIRFDAAEGFFLNGQPLKLKGTCNHQDHAGVGVALPDSIHEFRIRRLKEMGCNAYRCAHHPPAPELLDACDRLGMLVMDENRTFGSSPEHMSQLRSMVLRDRNHPSVILWSLCNEEAIQGTPVAANIAKAMAAEVRRLDASRPITAAVSGGILNDDCIADSIDICGINYQLPMHDPYHAKHPSVPVIAAETHSTFSTRGTYETAGHYHASYDEDAAPWGATARTTWRHVSSREYIAGLFAWTGFDYRGEPTPHGWPAVSSAFGIMDTCGFAKDAFYLHKAWWTDEPFVHVLPHWNWDDGRDVRVQAYTNGDAAELFLNGESLGRKRVDPIDMAEWRLAFRPGTLRALAYRGDRVVAEAIVQTTGPSVAMGLEVHPSARGDAIPADGAFALPITVFAIDARGRRVPTADDPVMFAIDGPATILGVGNGDPTCHEPDKALSRSLFRGLAQVIVQTTTTPGEITLSASAPNRVPATLRLTASAASPRRAVAPARRRLLLTDWRMSPITRDRPDVTVDVAAGDMNSWERITPGQPQSAWNAASGFAIYRTTFTAPKSLQTSGGAVLFRGIDGRAEVFMNGSPAFLNGGRVAFPATAAPIALTVLVHGDRPTSGLTQPVEIVR